jgi:hypothetical protein
MRAALPLGPGCPPLLQGEPPQQGQQHPRPCFGGAAVRDLALALGVAGLPLTTLVLDFTCLGDEAAEALAPGLQRCAALKVLSLRGCGLSAAGASAVAGALTPPLAAAAAGGSGSGGSSSGAAAVAAVSAHHSRFRPPALALGAGAAGGAPAGPWRGHALTSLDLSHNPSIGGLGLLSVNALLRHTPSMEVRQRRMRAPRRFARL